MEFDTPADSIENQAANKPIVKTKDMTITDELTDVGWIDDLLRRDMMKAFYLNKHGQYFENGFRHKE